MSESSPSLPEARPTQRKPIHWLPYLTVGVLFLVIGVGLGSAGNAGAGKVATPQACLDYMDSSMEVISLAGDTIGDMGDGFGIASDVMSNPFGSHSAGISRMDTMAENISDRTGQIEALAPDLLQQAEECRG
jgi:hypothetical protein